MNSRRPAPILRYASFFLLLIPVLWRLWSTPSPYVPLALLMLAVVLIWLQVRTNLRRYGKPESPEQRRRFLRRALR